MRLGLFVVGICMLCVTCVESDPNDDGERDTESEDIAARFARESGHMCVTVDQQCAGMIPGDGLTTKMCEKSRQIDLLMLGQRDDNDESQRCAQAMLDRTICTATLDCDGLAEWRRGEGPCAMDSVREEQACENVMWAQPAYAAPQEYWPERYNQIAGALCDSLEDQCVERQSDFPYDAADCVYRTQAPLAGLRQMGNGDKDIACASAMVDYQVCLGALDCAALASAYANGEPCRALARTASEECDALPWMHPSVPTQQAARIERLAQVGETMCATVGESCRDLLGERGFTQSVCQRHIRREMDVLSLYDPLQDDHACAYAMMDFLDCVSSLDCAQWLDFLKGGATCRTRYEIERHECYAARQLLFDDPSIEPCLTDAFCGDGTCVYDTLTCDL